MTENRPGWTRPRGSGERGTPINRPATKQRIIDADELRIHGTGLATGVIGQALVSRHITRLEGHLQEVMAKRPPAYKRPVKSLTREVFDALQGIPKATIAAAMLRGCIDCHHIVGQKAPPRVFTGMGDRLMTEARGVFVRDAMKTILGKDDGREEFARLKKAVAREASMYKKLRVEQGVLRKHAITFDPWPRALQARVGIFACDMLLTALPDVIVADKHRIPRMSEQAAEEIEVDLYAHPVYEPAADLPPFGFFSFDGIDGDTFVVNCRDVKAVRAAIARGIPHVDAVNYLRSIKFRINDHALGVVKMMQGSPYVGGKYTTSKDSTALEEFSFVSPARFLTRPWADLLRKVKDDGAVTLLNQNIAMADRWAGRPFKIQLRIDFRGRLIAGPNLNYTAPDHIRGLLKLDQTAPLTKDGLYWLKIACATSYDEYKEVSKQTFDRRLAWTEENLERICQAGRNPLDHLTWLADAGDPIQCVALFHELAHAVEHDLGYPCSVPIGFDASCSGLQHFALLARDKSAAELTNLVPTEAEDIRPDVYVAPEVLRGPYEGRDDDVLVVADRPPSSTREYVAPQDIYDFVQMHVKRALARSEKDGDELAEWWLGSPLKVVDGEIQLQPSRLDRKILKALVMTYGYSAEEWGQQSGILKVLRKRSGYDPKNAVRVQYLVKLVRKAIETLIPTAPKIMKALQELVPKYTVINPETGEVVGEYEQLGLATKAAKALTKSTGKKHQPRRPTEYAHWVSPSGLPVANSYPKSRSSPIRSYLLGRLVRPKTGVEWLPEQQYAKARRSIAPNYIHSIDAGHLALVANACAREGIELVTVHDSYAVLPPHAARLRDILLEELRAMYANWNPPWPSGDLDINEVTGPYAFS